MLRAPSPARCMNLSSSGRRAAAKGTHRSCRARMVVIRVARELGVGPAHPAEHCHEKHTTRNAPLRYLVPSGRPTVVICRFLSERVSEVYAQATFRAERNRLQRYETPLFTPVIPTPSSAVPRSRMSQPTFKLACSHSCTARRQQCTPLPPSLDSYHGQPLKQLEQGYPLGSHR